MSVKEFSSASMRRAWPRQLIVWEYKAKEWQLCTDEKVLKEIKYVAISYRQADWERAELEQCVQPLCRQILSSESMYPPAYWLDVACMGPDVEELKHDLYLMADVFKYATQVLIAIQDKGRDDEDGVTRGWQRWGQRVWTLPEALLGCRRLNYVIRGKALERGVALSLVANMAYKNRLDESEWRLIESFEPGPSLTVADRMRCGYTAVCNREIGLGTDGISPIKGFKADRVYALMGVFSRRIKPDPQEDEETALGRLAHELGVSIRVVTAEGQFWATDLQQYIVHPQGTAKRGAEDKLKQKIVNTAYSSNVIDAVPVFSQTTFTVSDSRIEPTFQEHEPEALDHESTRRVTDGSSNGAHQSTKSPVHGPQRSGAGENKKPTDETSTTDTNILLGSLPEIASAQTGPPALLPQVGHHICSLATQAKRHPDRTVDGFNNNDPQREVSILIFPCTEISRSRPTDICAKRASSGTSP